MRGKLLALALAAALTASAACAEAYQGTTVAGSSVALEAQTGGTLEEFSASVGEIVSEGEVLGRVRTTRVYANRDGTVARVMAGEGERADGTALEVYPLSRYQIYCTVDEAYSSPETMLVHSGEELYIKCTANGTHRATGVITFIEGEEYRVACTGGELYVGETVYLYRDADFSSSQRVGIGTVVTSDTDVYEADGEIVRMYVSEGDYVERGQLLYEVLEEGGEEIEATASGILTQAASAGDMIEAGQTIATIVPLEEIYVEFLVDEMEAASIAEGERVALSFAQDEDASVGGTVERISRIGESEGYRVTVRPDEAQNLRLGMTATVRTGEIE